MEKNLTTGSVLKNLLLFSMPYLLSYFLQTLYGMADLFIIGQFGGVANTTAVSVGSQLMHMLTVMIVGLAMGTTVSIGQAVGGKNRKQAAQRSFDWADSICAAISGTVCLPAFISVSADTFVHADGRNCPFCIISLPLHWYACRVCISPPSCSRQLCSQWDLPPQQAHSFL